MNEEQYKIVCARRQSFDSYVWQTPALAIAAQAFLLSTAFDDKTSSSAAIALSIFSALVGLASFQLMLKHRRLEVEDCDRLVRFERENNGYAVLHGKADDRLRQGRNWLEKMSSFRIWCTLLLGFPLLAFYAGLSVIWR